MGEDLSGAGGGEWLPPGSRIGGYVIEKKIGSSTMAAVYRAREERLDRVVALKVLSPTLAADPDFRARFLDEFQKVAALEEPHIVPLYGAGEASGTVYVATRFVPGGDLASVLKQAGGPLEPARAASLITQVAAALDAVHAKELVFHDVKPGNILIDTTEGRPEHAYLSDVGLSSAVVAQSLTPGDVVLGPPEYCAPEQLTGAPVSARTDQYALACVAFHLLTGHMPFPRKDRPAVRQAHITEPVPSAVELVPGLPARVDEVLSRGMAKNPAGRHPSCVAFAEALRNALQPPAPQMNDFMRDDQPRSDNRGQTAQGPGGVNIRDSSFVQVGKKPRMTSIFHGAVNFRGDPRSAPPGSAPARLRRRRAVLAASILAALIVAVGGGFTGGRFLAPASRASGSPVATGGAVRVATFTPPGGVSLGHVIASHDFTLLAGQSARISPAVYVWNMTARRHVATLTLPSKVSFQALGFTADDTALVVAAQSGVSPKYYQFDLATGTVTPLGQLPDTSLRIPFSVPSDTIAFESQGGAGITVSDFGGSTIADLPNPTPASAIIDNSIGLDDAASELILTGKNKNVYVVDLRSRAVLRTFHCPYLTYKDSADNVAPALTPDGFDVYCPSISGAPATLWDIATDANITPEDPRWAPGSEGTLALGHDGLIATQDSDTSSTVVLWSALTGRYLRTIQLPAAVGVTLDDIGPGGHELLTSSWNPATSTWTQLTLWNVS
jgi:serine/threonine protein kinase